MANSTRAEQTRRTRSHTRHTRRTALRGATRRLSRCHLASVLSRQPLDCRQLRQVGRRVLTRSFDTRSKASIDLAALAIKPGSSEPHLTTSGRATYTIRFPLTKSQQNVTALMRPELVSCVGVMRNMFIMSYDRHVESCQNCKVSNREQKHLD